MLKKVFALIPVSELKKAKSRLKLKEKEKKELILAMLKDVLDAVKNAKINAVVISPNDFSEICNAYGFYFIKDENNERKDLNKSIELANKFAIKKGAEATIFIPADMPLISKEDIEEFLKYGLHYNVVISRAEDAGTGLLLRKPCNIIPTFFGENSFEKHLEYAKERGIKVKIISNERVNFDIDKKEDLMKKEIFLKSGKEKNIYKVVEKLWERCFNGV